MRLCVTGAKGFIGSILTVRAAELGHTVWALDDESRGLNTVDDLPGVRYARYDCRRGIADAVPDRLDAVVHLAAGTGSLERPIEELRELNVEMMCRVYEDAIRAGARFAWPTTSLALGVPDSPYVVSKEEGLRWLVTNGDLRRVVALRFFNMVGAYQGRTERRRNEVHMLPALIRCHAERIPFRISGTDYDTSDGSPARDFVNVLDAVEYVLALVTGSCRPEPHADGAVWVGTGAQTTVLEAVDVFRRFVGPVEIESGPRRAYDCGMLRCDPAQIARFRDFRRGTLAPSWVSIRDEALALLGR